MRRNEAAGLPRSRQRADFRQSPPRGHPLRFAAYVERLDNGNTLICNWTGHGHERKQPLLVEVTPDKRVVWQFDGRDRFRGIIGLQLLDGIRARP